GVVVVDDNPDGAARAVADDWGARFALGVRYLTAGRQNISYARNLGLEAGAQWGDFMLMTDDDCEPPPNWIAAHLAAQRQADCDATTGAMKLRVRSGQVPRWLIEQPFFDDYLLKAEHLQEVDGAGTNNVMIRTDWLRAHPEIRFREDLGRSGGEDWVFF